MVLVINDHSSHPNWTRVNHGLSSIQAKVDVTADRRAQVVCAGFTYEVWHSETAQTMNSRICVGSIAKNYAILGNYELPVLAIEQPRRTQFLYLHLCYLFSGGSLKRKQR